MVTMVTFGVLLLLPVGVLMESLLCWYLVTIIMSAPLPTMTV